MAAAAQSVLGFIWDKIQAFGAWILGVVGTVADVIAGLAILPLVSFIAAIVDVFSNALIGLMQLIGPTTLAMFKLDIGNGSSLFETVFGAMSGEITVMTIMAFALAAVFCVMGVLHAMSMPSSREHPVGLIFRAALCAGGIIISPRVIIFAQRFFGAFCAAILSGATDFRHGFFGTSLQWFIADATEGHLPVSFGAQIAALTGSVVYLIMLIMITVQFYSFFTKFVTRYVMLGVTLVISPVAVAFGASQATSRTFKMWARAVVTQLLVLTLDVMIAAAFFSAFNASPTSLERFFANNSGASPVAAVFVWCVILMAILYVGIRMDTFLRALGLGVREAAGGMLRSGLSTMVMAFSFGGTGSGGGHPMTADQTPAQPSAVGYPNVLVTSIGAPPPEKKGAGESDMAGYEVGSAVINNCRGIPHSFKSSLDLKSCRVDAAGITIQGIQNAQGGDLSLRMVPTGDSPKETSLPLGGRDVMIGGQPHRAYASGDKARSFYTSNPKAREEFSKMYGPGVVSPLKDDSGQSLGIYQMQAPLQDGRVETTTWAPSTCYHPAPGVDATVERIGDLDYWRHSTTSPAEGLPVRCTDPVPPPANVQDQGDWLRQQFPDIDASIGAEITSVHPIADSGVYSIETPDGSYLLAPSSEVGLDAGVDANGLTAENGALYAVIPHEEGLTDEQLQDMLADPDQQVDGTGFKDICQRSAKFVRDGQTLGKTAKTSSILREAISRGGKK